MRRPFLLVTALVGLACGDSDSSTPGVTTTVGASTASPTTSTGTPSSSTTASASASGASGSSTTATPDDTSDATAGTGGESDTGGEPVGTPFVYVGGYTDAIRVYTFDPSNGALAPVGAPVPSGINPSFLAIDAEHLRLFAVNETDTFDGQQTGSVSSFTIDPATGRLTFVNRVSSQGQGPAHVAVDRTGAWVLVATYNGGTAASIPVTGAATLGVPASVVQHGGGAQSHQILTDRANAFALVPNKGLNNVAQYVFDAATGVLTPNAVPSVATASGAGPRHVAFHPTLDVVYLIDELDNTIVVYGYDAATGRLSQRQVASTLPGGANGQSTAAEVSVHPGGRFLYGSNRGHDSIVVYAIDATNGQITLVGHTPTGGSTPRHFSIAPGGRILLVANQNSSTIVSFAIDEATGIPSPTGQQTEAPQPTFVEVVYLPGA